MTKKQIRFVPIGKLKCHEAVSKKRVSELIEDIKFHGLLINPVVVSKQSYVVLDGHHRVAALKRIGACKVPVFFVDYFSNNVKVYLRRKNLLITLLKEAVINRALQGKMFPMKTTRHWIKDRKRNIRIKFEALTTDRF